MNPDDLDHRTAKFPVPNPVALLLLNAIPLGHVLSLIALTCWITARASWSAAVLCALAWLYLLPPLVARLVLRLRPISATHIALGSRDYFTWWTLFNLQVLFCRLVFLEEILRLIPGLYSAWLRLWGARIGRLTYWAAGTCILDRSFLEIGDFVVFGAAVRLNGHVVIRNGAGDLELLLADIRIGSNALVGGYSLLTAGTEIAAGECTRAFLMSPPFTRWQNGSRARADAAGKTDAAA